MSPSEHSHAWHQLLNELNQWVAVHGSLSGLRQSDTGRDGFPLGNRIRAVRQDRMRGSLTDSQIATLEALPGWAWSPRRATWLAQFERARDYFAHPDQSTQMPRAIGDWLYQVRRAHRDGQLDQDQRDLLETVPQILHNSAAASLARALQQWLKHHPGSTIADITRDSALDGSPLLQRIIRVRHLREDDALDSYEIQALESLPGWRW